MKRYYLETNSLRKLNNQLLEIQDKCYTSSLSIFELISGISQEQFEIRKRVISNVLFSELYINWDFPEKIKIDSFPNLEIDERRVDDLKRLCEILIDSNNLEEFIELSNGLKYNYDFFNSLDSSYSKNFINATEAGNERLKSIYSNEKNKNGKFFEKLAKEYVKSLPKTTKLNKSLTLTGLVNGIADSLENISGKNTIDRDKLFYAYNGNINIFIEAFSLFAGLKSADLNLPAKNDFIDLHHLLYLGNNSNNIIISDDKLLLMITEQVLNTKEFLKTITE
tara:strand:+ start:61 stop:900 length:840 start_codon:yes stop_codon:yes gene_type:complete